MDTFYEVIGENIRRTVLMQSMYFMTDMIFLQREKIMKGWENQKMCMNI